MAIKHNPQNDGTAGNIGQADYNADHTIDAGSIGTAELAANAVTTAKLATTAVTAGSYTNTNLTVGADGRVTAASNGSGGGGGITNSAGANVVMLSNGTNAVASGITDDGTKVLVSRQLGVGSAVPFAYRKMQITGASATDEEMLWIEDNATGHVGTGGQNQAINLVLRQQGTSNTTAATATATGCDVAVTQTISSGANPLVNTAVLANASGGTTNYAWYSSNGLMVQTGDASFGNFTATGTCSVTGTCGIGGATTIGGNLTVSALATLGTAGAGSTHVINGNINLRSNNTDTYLNIKNNSTGGRDWFFEASGSGGTDPNCIAIYDNTAGATRFKIDLNGNVIANVAFQVGSFGKFRSGSVTPNTNVVGSVGDFYTWTGGGAGTTLWVKESGSSSNTGWVSK